jgi:hypothetical protein
MTDAAPAGLRGWPPSSPAERPKSASYPAHNYDQPIDNQPCDRDRAERNESVHTPSPKLGISQVLIEILHTGREICDGVCACIKPPISEAVEDLLGQKNAHYGPEHRGDDPDPLPIQAHIGIPAR